MYVTNLGFKWSFLFELNFLKIQTDIIMQQTQTKNDKPPTEPMALNRITLSFILVSLFDFWFELPVVRTGVESFDRK